MIRVLIRETVRELLIEASLDKMRNMGVPDEIANHLHQLAGECGEQSFWFAQQFKANMHQWDDFINLYKESAKIWKRANKRLDKEIKKRGMTVYDDTQGLADEIGVSKAMQDGVNRQNIYLKHLKKIINDTSETIDLICKWAKETGVVLSKKKVIEISNPDQDGEMIKVSFDMAVAEKAAQQHFKIKTGTVFMTFQNDWYWLDREVSFCSIEAKLMQHCGNANNSDSTLWSLRDPQGLPHVTAEILSSEEGRDILQMKGKQNTKPDEKYMEYIYALLTDEDFNIRTYAVNDRHGGEDLEWDNIPPNIQEEIESQPNWAGIDAKDIWTDRADEIYREYIENNGPFENLSVNFDSSSAEELDDGTWYMNLDVSADFSFSSNEHRISSVAYKLHEVDGSDLENLFPWNIGSDGVSLWVSPPQKQATEWSPAHEDTKLGVTIRQEDSEYASSEEEFISLLDSANSFDGDLEGTNVKKNVEKWLYENDYLLLAESEDIYDKLIQHKFENFRASYSDSGMKISPLGTSWDGLKIEMPYLADVESFNAGNFFLQILKDEGVTDVRDFSGRIRVQQYSPAEHIWTTSRARIIETPPVRLSFVLGIRDIKHEYEQQTLDDKMRIFHWVDENWDMILKRLSDHVRKLPHRYPLDEVPKSWSHLEKAMATSNQDYINSVLAFAARGDNVGLSLYVDNRVQSYDLPGIKDRYGFEMPISRRLESMTYRKWFKWLPQEIKRFLEANTNKDNLKQEQILRSLVRSIL
jgi:hypothetical protein